MLQNIENNFIDSNKKAFFVFNEEGLWKIVFQNSHALMKTREEAIF